MLLLLLLLLLLVQIKLLFGKIYKLIFAYLKLSLGLTIKVL